MDILDAKDVQFPNGVKQPYSGKDIVDIVDLLCQLRHNRNMIQLAAAAIVFQIIIVPLIAGVMKFFSVYYGIPEESLKPSSGLASESPPAR